MVKPIYKGGQAVIAAGHKTSVIWTTFLGQWGSDIFYDCLIPTGKKTKEGEIIKVPKRFNEAELTSA